MKFSSHSILWQPELSREKIEEINMRRKGKSEGEERKRSASRSASRAAAREEAGDSSRRASEGDDRDRRRQQQQVRQHEEQQKPRKRKKSPPAMRMRADDYEIKRAKEAKEAKEEKRTRLKSTVVNKAKVKARVEVEEEEEEGDEEMENLLNLAAEPAAASLEKSDLRHQLKERKRRLEDLRTSGLKVQVTNELAAEKRAQSPPVTEVEVRSTLND